MEVIIGNPNRIDKEALIGSERERNKKRGKLLREKASQSASDRSSKYTGGKAATTFKTGGERGEVKRAENYSTRRHRSQQVTAQANTQAARLPPHSKRGVSGSEVKRAGNYSTRRHRNQQVTAQANTQAARYATTFKKSKEKKRSSGLFSVRRRSTRVSDAAAQHRHLRVSKPSRRRVPYRTMNTVQRKSGWWARIWSRDGRTPLLVKRHKRHKSSGRLRSNSRVIKQRRRNRSSKYKGRSRPYSYKRDHAASEYMGDRLVNAPKKREHLRTKEDEKYARMGNKLWQTSTKTHDHTKLSFNTKEQSSRVVSMVSAPYARFLHSIFPPKKTRQNSRVPKGQQKKERKPRYDNKERKIWYY